MANEHEKVHVICENLCLEEGMTKEQIEDLVNEEETNRKAEVSVERARIDNLAHLTAGSTTGDAELTDIRIGFNGVTYPNAGSAVRNQVKQTFDDINKLNTTTDFGGKYVDLESNQILNWALGYIDYGATKLVVGQPIVITASGSYSYCYINAVGGDKIKCTFRRSNVNYRHIIGVDDNNIVKWIDTSFDTTVIGVITDHIVEIPKALGITKIALCSQSTSAPQSTYFKVAKYEKKK